MRALNSHFVLIDLQTSWHSANQIPTSTFSYLKNTTSFANSLSETFRRASRSRSRISSSSASSVPSIRPPGIRRPVDRTAPGNGLSSVSSDMVPTMSLRTGEVSELDLFLELVPLRMREELFGHKEIGELIEVVMDLGRQPVARFPSGDWAISEEVVKPDDLRHAISKVI